MIVLTNTQRELVRKFGATNGFIAHIETGGTLPAKNRTTVDS